MADLMGGDEMGNMLADKGIRRGTGDKSGDGLVDKGIKRGTGDETGNDSAGGGVHMASLVHRGSKHSRSGNKEVRAGGELRTGGGDRVSEVLQALDEGENT